MNASNCDFVGAEPSRPSGRNDLTVGRLHREWQTMSAMIRIYCEGQHGTHGELCAECRAMSDYAEVRLGRCRFGAEKPTCANCPVHCYAPAWREKVRAMMRYSGPRMIWSHPILALLHMVDGRRSANEASRL